MFKKVAVIGAVLSPVAMFAQTDLTGVLDTLGGYKTTALVIGVAGIAWVIGKSVVRRFVK